MCPFGALSSVPRTKCDEPPFVWINPLDEQEKFAVHTLEGLHTRRSPRILFQDERRRFAGWRLEKGARDGAPTVISRSVLEGNLQGDRSGIRHRKNRARHFVFDDQRIVWIRFAPFA